MNGNRCNPMCWCTRIPASLTQVLSSPQVGQFSRPWYGRSLSALANVQLQRHTALGHVTTSHPPGRSTRTSSRTVASGEGVCSTHSDDTTMSKEPSRIGIRAASPATSAVMPLRRATVEAHHRGQELLLGEHCASRLGSRFSWRSKHRGRRPYHIAVGVSQASTGGFLSSPISSSTT